MFSKIMSVPLDIVILEQVLSLLEVEALTLRFFLISYISLDTGEFSGRMGLPKPEICLKNIIHNYVVYKYTYNPQSCAYTKYRNIHAELWVQNNFLYSSFKCHL